ncbi:hypothetical protein ACIBG0_41290 [Nocardia sp. NPDC050630]|uniref:hypothetical protein n=1 Tax=Nocardia sp. NPDC050630 TaxID=3364321 RepID=UPI0037BD1CED
MRLAPLDLYGREVVVSWETGDRAGADLEAVAGQTDGSLSALVDRLGHDRLEERNVARAQLEAAGASAVPALALVLYRCGSRQFVDHRARRLARDSIAILTTIGDLALVPLAQAISTVSGEVSEADTVGETAGGSVRGLRLLEDALRALQVTDVAKYVPLLEHPNERVRGTSLRVFERLGPDAGRFVAQVVPLVDDPSEFVSDRAKAVVAAIGSGALSALRHADVPIRPRALRALVELDGWDPFDAEDRALVERLIQMTIPSEVPEPMEFEGSWYAAPTSDQAGVIDALDLSDVFKVTTRLGTAIWYKEELCGCVYIAPALNNWILIFGHELGNKKVFATLSTLSSRFEAAYWYDQFEGTAAWGMAEKGKIVRYFDSEDPDEQIGPPHPAERDYNRVFDIARHTSIDPREIGPHTRMEGHGVVVLTVAGTRYGLPSGIMAQLR